MFHVFHVFNLFISFREHLSQYHLLIITCPIFKVVVTQWIFFLQPFTNGILSPSPQIGSRAKSYII